MAGKGKRLLIRPATPRARPWCSGGAAAWVLVQLVRDSNGHSVKTLDAVATQSRFEKYVRFKKRITGKQGKVLIDTTITESIAKHAPARWSSHTLRPAYPGTAAGPGRQHKSAPAGPLGSSSLSSRRLGEG